MARVATVDVITNVKLTNETSVGGSCVVNYGTYHHPLVKTTPATYLPSPLTDRATVIDGSDWTNIEDKLTLRFDHTYYNSVDGGGV